MRPAFVYPRGWSMCHARGRCSRSLVILLIARVRRVLLALFLTVLGHVGCVVSVVSSAVGVLCAEEEQGSTSYNNDGRKQHHPQGEGDGSTTQRAEEGSITPKEGARGKGPARRPFCFLHWSLVCFTFLFSMRFHVFLLFSHFFSRQDNSETKR